MSDEDRDYRLGAKIRRAREEQGLSYSFLSEQTGAPAWRISGLEKGVVRYIPRLEKRLCDYLGIDMEE